MSTHHDRVFFVSFLSVLGFLFLFTFAIIIAANAIEGEQELTKQQIAKIEDRIRRPGTGPAAAAPVEGAPKVPLTGEQVVAQVCTACHTGALPNAPKIGDKAAWSARGNLKALTATAITGKGAMPPRGGKMDLTDAEVEAAVKHMSGL